jgi:protein phosphatase 1 regulatory subunit 11
MADQDQQLQSADQAQTARKTRTEEEERPPTRVLMLRLKREEDELKKRQRIQWDSNVVEHPNQKSSKKCCQFHRKRLFGESDSDEECHSDYDSDYDVPGAEHRHNHHHPKCSKEACHCGTRFA